MVRISLQSNGTTFPVFYCEEGGSLLAIARTLDALELRFEYQDTSEDGIHYSIGSGIGFDGSKIKFIAIIEGKRGRKVATPPATV